MKRPLLLLILCALLCGAASVAPAHTIHVDWAASGDVATIQDGLDAASSWDTVLVHPGTYSGGGNRNLNFAGKDIVLISLSGMNKTVIDMLDDFDRGFNFVSGETPLAIVDGFTVTNANVFGGAGFYCADSSPTIRNCRIVNCNAYGDHHTEGWGGAGLLVRSSSLVENCIIEHNCAHCCCGGLATHSSNVTIRSCVFASNRDFWEGRAAVDVRYSSAATIEGCTFLDNLGGGVSIGGWSTASISGCTFVGNASGHPVIRVHPEYGSGIEITRSVFAFNDSSAPVECGSSGPDISSCCFFESGTDSLCGGSSAELNLFEDPRFCGLHSSDLTLCENSPCLPSNNDWSVEVGAHGQGCGPCDSPVEATSWGCIKAMFR